METDRPKTNATETLTDLVLEFLETAVHEFLFAWHVYPREAFEPRVLYDVPIHMSRHPLLCEYIHSMLTGCRTWLRRGELEKLCIILLSEEGRAVETLAIEPGWSAAFLEAASADEDYPLPLVALEEAFRAGMVALVAMPVPDNMNQTDSNNSSPQTFRILAQTVEDACNQDTSIDEKNAGNSWVLADPFWCEGQKKPKEIYPVKSIQSQVSPIRLNVYIEKQQTAAVTEVSER